MINILRKKIFFLKSVSSIKNLPDNSLFEFCFWLEPYYIHTTFAKTLRQITILVKVH